MKTVKRAIMAASGFPVALSFGWKELRATHSGEACNKNVFFKCLFVFVCVLFWACFSSSRGARLLVLSRELGINSSSGSS